MNREMARYVVAWLNHEQAKVTPLIREGWSEWAVSPDGREIHNRARPGSHADGHYFNEIADALRGASVILIVGPGTPKHELMRHLSVNEPEVTARVVGLESMDEPRESDIARLAKEHFRSADRAN